MTTDLAASPLVDEVTYRDDDAVVQRGQRTFMEVGSALQRIHAGRAYLFDGFSSFEAYLAARGMSRPRGYQLMQAVEVVAEMSTQVAAAALPANERQARELVPLSADERVAVAAEVDLSRVSTRQLRQVIKDRRVDRVRNARREMLASAPPTVLDDGAFSCIREDAASISNLSAYDDVDLIITSPPYGLGLEGSDQDSSLDWSAYLDNASDWAKAMYEVLHPDHGRLCLNVPLDRTKGAHEPAYADWTTTLLDAGFKYEASIVWNEGNTSAHAARGSVGSPNSPHAIAPVEMVIVVYRGTWDRREPKRVSDIALEDWTNWLSNVWTFAGEHRYRVGHMAPFPEELVRRLVQLYSFPGDLVGDPFVGSGTTPAVALRLGRRVVCSDIDQECVELTRARVQREVGE